MKQPSLFHTLITTVFKRTTPPDRPTLLSQQPQANDLEAWPAYWKTQNQPWRTHPEIDKERQKYLDECRVTPSDIERGVYPFKNIEPKLTRADIEWLLTTHENGHGPIDWSDESQREREGLDLRGAMLFEADLNGLPLARLQGGLGWREETGWTYEQRKMAAVKLIGANLEGAHLEGVILELARLEVGQS